MTQNTPPIIDLHSHSLLSDGLLTPADVAARAAANNVQLWSLTDHDELAGLDEAARAAASLGMHFIPGVEISTTWANRTIHIVGLNIDPDNTQLVAGLERIRTERLGRGEKISYKLEQMGIKGAYEGAARYARNPQLLSRTHFARFLVKQGHCRSMQEVFQRYLGDHCPANVRIHWCNLEEAVTWITGAGGRAVIAHPGRYNFSALEAAALYDEFIRLGGSAIEVTTGSHTSQQFAEYATVVRQYGFLASSGSDFHGPDESRLDLGQQPALPADLTPVWHDWL